jgi:uncharacterized RDD family membrane protein YckC
VLTTVSDREAKTIPPPIVPAEGPSTRSSVTFAPILDRVLAYGTDLVIVAFIEVVFLTIVAGWKSRFLWLVAPCLYFTWFHGSRGATLGKRLFLLRVSRCDGSRLSYGRAFSRFWAALLTLLTLTFGFWIACFDHRRRSLHDWIAGTIVVREEGQVAYRADRQSAKSAKYAGFWIRTGALLVDVVVMITLWCPWGLFAIWCEHHHKGDPLYNLVQQITPAVPWLIAILYSAGFLGTFGATPGKMVFELAVVRKDDSSLGLRLAFIRSLVFVGGWLLFNLLGMIHVTADNILLWFLIVVPVGFVSFVAYVTPFLGCAAAAFDSQKRALHDRICGTRVIHLE